MGLHREIAEWYHYREKIPSPETRRIPETKAKYRLTRGRATRYRNKGMLICQRCGLDLKAGDLVVSRSSGKRSGNKLYHLECARILNISYTEPRRSRRDDPPTGLEEELNKVKEDPVHV